MLLTQTREGRDRLRAIKLYPIIRELHSHSGSEEVKETCDRIVQTIMRGEEGEEREDEKKIKEITEGTSVDEEEQIVEVA